MNKNFYWIGFLLFVGLNLLGEALQIQPLVWGTKPFLMIWLAVWFWQSTRCVPHPVRVPVVVALAFSAIADAILLLPEWESGMRDFFLFGLTAFLVAHCFYVIALQILRKNDTLSVREKWIAAIVVLVLLVLLFQYFGDTDALFPIVLYTSTLLVVLGMVLSLRTSVRGNLLLYGIVLFMASDALVGAAFLQWIPKSGNAWYPLVRVAIMSLYVAGQVFLVRGVKTHLLPKDALRQSKTQIR